MTDRIDGPETSSSEDLIRQAREAYVPPSDAPPAPSRQVTPPTAQVPGTPTQTHPSDYVRAEYQSEVATPGTAIPGGAVTYQPERPSFFKRFAGLTIGLVIVLGFVLFSVFDKTTNVEDLAVGDCLLMPNSEEISSVESADCAENHELEVFALVRLPDGDSAPYPGEDNVANAILDRCQPSFERYVGTAYSDSIWYVNAIFPTRESWEDVDDREGTCVVFQLGPGDEIATITGSARGSAQ